MRTAFLHDPSIVLGARAASVEETSAAGLLRSRADALRRAGFATLRLARPGESATDLAHDALLPLAQRHEDAGALLVASTLVSPRSAPEVSPRSAPDAPRSAPDSPRCAQGAPSVTERLDLSGVRLLARLPLQRAFVAGVTQQACTSSLGALRMARALVASEPHLAPVLVAACDRVPDGALREQGFCPLSDGAAACVVSPEPRGFRLVGFHATTHAAAADATDEEAMGRLFPVVHALVNELLRSAARSPRDVARLVPPNLPAAAARIVARTLEIPEERAASPTLADAAHVMSCDPLVNLAALESRGAFDPGDLVVLLSAGYGLTWQAALLERMPS